MVNLDFITISSMVSNYYFLQNIACSSLYYKDFDLVCQENCSNSNLMCGKHFEKIF